MRRIQVFEHETIRIGEVRQGVCFEKHHFDALVWYLEAKNCSYYTVVYQGIKFSSYVGAIQIGDLTLEILPKADRKNQNYSLWQGVLLDMLKACRYLSLDVQEYAQLKPRAYSLLDIFLLEYLREVEKLLHQGLIKRYRKVEENQKTWRGNLQFAKHLQHNLIHKERFFVQSQTYDFQHLLNEILLAALQLIHFATPHSDIIQRNKTLAQSFPEIQPRKISSKDFQKIHYNRKTSAYKPAINYARQIILNYSSDIQGGVENLIALMFDMNQLWEEYIFQALKKLESSNGFSVEYQVTYPFWRNQKLKPDIVISSGSGRKIVLDTKWKILNSATPSDQDLRQIYAYCHYCGAEEGILLYPKAGAVGPVRLDFNSPSKLFRSSLTPMCQLMFISVLDNHHQLNSNLGEELSVLLAG